MHSETSDSETSDSEISDSVTIGEEIAAGQEQRTVLDVEIWSDIVCPWCYIGKRKFESALAEMKTSRPDVDVRVSYRAFMLDPNAPVDTAEKVLDVYAKKFGGPEKANQLIENVVNEAAHVGLDFDMDSALRANTHRAHRLLVLAEANGLQLEMKERLMQAYFCQGQAVGDISVLAELAAEVGLPLSEATAWLESDQGSDEVAQQLEDGMKLGISSVPTFVMNRDFGVPGAQSPDYFFKIMDKLTTPGID